MQIDMASITCAPQMSFPRDPSGLWCSAGFVATLSSVISAKPAELVAKRADAAKTQKSLLSTMFLRGVPSSTNWHRRASTRSAAEAGRRAAGVRHLSGRPEDRAARQSLRGRQPRRAQRHAQHDRLPGQGEGLEPRTGLYGGERRRRSQRRAIGRCAEPGCHGDPQPRHLQALTKRRAGAATTCVANSVSSSLA